MHVFSADLQALTDDVANRLNAPTVLEDDEQRMVAYSSHSAPTDHVRRDSILRKETQPAIRDWFRKYGIVAATEPLRIPCDRRLGILGRLCIPVRNHGLLMGFLWLIDDDEGLDSQAVAVACESARHAGQLMYEELLAERLGSSMLSHLLSPSEELRQIATEQVTAEGLLSPGWEVVVAVVKVSGAHRVDAKVLINDGLRDVTRQHSRGDLLGLAHADHGVLLVPGRHRGDHVSRCADLGCEARDALQRRLRSLDATAEIAVGVGDQQTDLADAHTSYRQARMAADVASAIARMSGVGIWRHLGVYRALAQLPTRQAMEAALDPRVDLLLRETDSAVLETVESYVDHGGDAQATAAELHLHRSTLYYRLQKAERSCALNLRDGDDRLAVHVGFKLARLVGRYPPGE